MSNCNQRPWAMEPSTAREASVRLEHGMRSFAEAIGKWNPEFAWKMKLGMLIEYRVHEAMLEIAEMRQAAMEEIDRILEIPEAF